MVVSGLNVNDFALAADGTDDSLAFWRAMDQAQAQVSGSTGAPAVFIPPGEYRWRTTGTLKSAPVIGAGMNSGTRIWWDGAAGATVMTKSTSHTGGASFGLMKGIAFIPGDHEPYCWLDTSTNVVDAGYRLTELEFVGGVGCAVRMVGYYNLHWTHIRFDGCGSGTDGFSIRLAPPAGQTLSSFVLDKFTNDNNRGALGGNGAEGLIFVDLSDNPSNAGTLVISNGRIEGNSGWSNRKGLVVVKVPDVGANPRSLGLSIENVTYQDVGPVTSGESLLYHDTAATNLYPSLVLSNFRQSGLSSIIGGSISASFPTIPVTNFYGYLAVGQGGNTEMFSGGRVFAGSLGVGNSAAATTPGTVTKKVQVFAADGTSLGFVPIYDAIS